MSSAVEASVDSFFGESPEGKLEKFRKREKKKRIFSRAKKPKSEWLPDKSEWWIGFGGINDNPIRLSGLKFFSKRSFKTAKKDIF